MGNEQQYSQQLRLPECDAVSRFKPGWLPSVCVALLLPALVTLGFWQLQRAEEKQWLLSLQQMRWQAEPQPVFEATATADLGYRRLVLEGYFDPHVSLFLDNRTRAGQAGVELLQPFFDVQSGLWLLLNRGWIAWPDRRETPAFHTPEGTIRLIASVYQAPPRALRAPMPVKAESPWPQLVSHIDSGSLWQQLNRQGFAQELRLEPGPASLVTDWPVVAMSPQKHQGYAVQWFALAAALLGLFIYLGLQNARELRHEPSRHSV